MTILIKFMSFHMEKLKQAHLQMLNGGRGEIRTRSVSNVTDFKSVVFHQFHHSPEKAFVSYSENYEASKNFHNLLWTAPSVKTKKYQLSENWLWMWVLPPFISAIISHGARLPASSTIKRTRTIYYGLYSLSMEKIWLHSFDLNEEQTH